MMAGGGMAGAVTAFLRFFTLVESYSDLTRSRKMCVYNTLLFGQLSFFRQACNIIKFYTVLRLVRGSSVRPTNSNRKF